MSESMEKMAKGGGKQGMSLIPLALLAPQPRHAGRGAQFPGFRLLCARNRERLNRQGLDIDQLVYEELHRMAGNRP